MAKGSIEKRGENTWRITVELGTLPDGTKDRERTTITVEDKAILRSKKKLEEYLDDELAKFKLKVLSGNYIKPEKTTLRYLSRMNGFQNTHPIRITYLHSLLRPIRGT